MSASTKKKLRKEQEAAAMTERQKAEQLQAKKLKRNTIIFVCIISLIVLTFLGIVVYRWFSTNAILQKATTSAEIGGEDFNAVEFSYYYHDAVNAAYSEWYSMAYEFAESADMDVNEAIAMLCGIDPSKPLDEQTVEADGDETWADYFVNQALEAAREDVALVKAAKAAGYTMTEEQKQILSNQETNLPAYAQIYGFPSVKAYLQASYGDGADVDTYMEFVERSMLADNYLEYYTEQLNATVYDAAAISEFVGEDGKNYDAYTYNYVYLSYTAFREDSEDGTYTDEQNDAARKAAKEAAEGLTSATTVEEFDEAIAALDLSTKASTAQTNQLYKNVSVVPIADWLVEGSHTEGQMAVLENKSTSGDINGYYVVRFESATDNSHSVCNIRHLLVAFDPDDSGVEVTDELKATTLATAEELLAQWEAGEKTEASFEALVREKSDDNADEGGLYTDVGEHTNFVEPFLNWCLDSKRTQGDCEIVETEYGYHIMYYCGMNDYTYRDSLIMQDMRAEDLTEWQAAQIEATPASVKSTSYLDLDMVLAGA